MKTTTQIALLLLLLSGTRDTLADTFGSGPSSFDIKFVPINNPGNVADTTGSPNSVGSVAERYRIGKYEISEEMLSKANAASASTANPLNITHSARGANRAATSISWIEATRFINWLNTSTGNTPAYKFDGSGNFLLWQSGDAGFDSANVYRNSLAKYFLPSVDEWYKAAHFDPTSGLYFDYATASNTAPTSVASGTAAGTAVFDQPFAPGPAEITLAGGLSPYKTMGQGGNVFEWEETDFDLVNDSTSSFRGLQGGSWSDDVSLLSATFRGFFSPTIESSSIGFRVASTPVLGDFDFDGDVDGSDFLRWQRGGSPTPLSSGDLANWEANFANPSSVSALSAISTTSVPEPSSLLLGALAVLGLSAGKRR